MVRDTLRPLSGTGGWGLGAGEPDRDLELALRTGVPPELRPRWDNPASQPPALSPQPREEPRMNRRRIDFLFTAVVLAVTAGAVLLSAQRVELPVPAALQNYQPVT